MNDTHTQRNETETHRDKMSKLSERELSRKPNLTSPGQVTTHFLLSGLSLHTGMRKERENEREWRSIHQLQRGACFPFDRRCDFFIDRRTKLAAFAFAALDTSNDSAFTAVARRHRPARSIPVTRQIVVDRTPLKDRSPPRNSSASSFY